MSTTDSSDKDYDDDFEWTPYNEVHLLHSMGTLKPLGLNQHFVMSYIIERFRSAIGRSVPGSVIIDKVKSYYNISEGQRKPALLPGPGPCEFSLPLDEFPNCINGRHSDRPSTPVEKEDRKKLTARKRFPEKKPPKRPRHTQ